MPKTSNGEPLERGGNQTLGNNAAGIVAYLKSHGKKASEENVCEALDIKIKDVPWGYNTGFARCLGVDQKFYLILSSVDALDITQN